jgi:hypothetical protein
MSATGRSDVRRADDFYQTPAWCVRRLMEAVEFPVGYWLEPAAGDGAIIRACNQVLTERSEKADWHASELRVEARPALSALVDPTQVFVGTDFLSGVFDGCEWDVAITNPPYSLALAFIQAMLPLADHVAVLVRLNFLASARRAGFFRTEMPDVYVLPNRPSFTEDGRTDATEYCWAVWTPERGRKRGYVHVLDETPSEERR